MNKPDWPTPTDLRCVGGPADGKWFAVPPEDYVRAECRGGAIWLWIDPWPVALPVVPDMYTPPIAGGGTLGNIHVPRMILTSPQWGQPCAPARSLGLPCESGHEQQP